LLLLSTARLLFLNPPPPAIPVTVTIDGSDILVTTGAPINLASYFPQLASTLGVNAASPVDLILSSKAYTQLVINNKF
jgi:hypothetical protein